MPNMAMPAITKTAATQKYRVITFFSGNLLFILLCPLLLRMAILWQFEAWYRQWI